jgi:hypothetical protein
MSMEPASTSQAFSLMAARRMTRVEILYSCTCIGVIPENKEPIIGCSARTRAGWLRRGLIVSVNAPNRPKCNHVYGLTKAGRAIAGSAA